MSMSATAGPAIEKSLIDLYLEEQRSLTAVEKFSRHHESRGGGAPPPPQRGLVTPGGPLRRAFAI
jgi:hypothetical protein